MNNAKIALKEKCLTATANYHPGIRYIIRDIALSIYIHLLMRASDSVLPAFEGDGGHRFGKQKSLPLLIPFLVKKASSFALSTPSAIPEDSMPGPQRRSPGPVTARRLFVNISNKNLVKFDGIDRKRASCESEE